MLFKNLEIFKDKEKSSNSEKNSAGVQTILFEENIMRCKDCEYPAEDIYDLGEHIVNRKKEHIEKVNTLYILFARNVKLLCKVINTACHKCYVAILYKVINTAGHVKFR